MKQTTRRNIRRWTGLMLAICIFGLMLPIGALADEPFYGVYTGGIEDNSHDADHEPLGDLVLPADFSDIQDDVYIYANENDIFRMLENIFSNCLRYCENSVVFKCTYDSKYVIFDISDDGPGISEEVQKHLFERFAKGSDGKHGIGLALADSIAQEHGGSITASNKSGEGEHGAVFEIRIPTAKCREQLSKLNNETED